MGNMNIIKIHFSQNLTHTSNVVFDANAILSELGNSNYINVPLDQKQTIEDINLLLFQLTKYLSQNKEKKYNYSSHEIVWGECIEMQKQIVIEATYYLHETYE